LGRSRRTDAHAAKRPARAAGVRAHRAAACRGYRPSAGDRQGLPAVAARVRGRARRGDRSRSDGAGSGGLPLAHALSDRGRTLLALGRARQDSFQGGGVGVDAGRGAGATGLGGSAGTAQRVRAARNAGSLSPVAPARTDRLPLRPAREPTRNPRLRSDRDAATRLLQVADLLIRLLRLALAAWVLRWVAQQLASYVTSLLNTDPSDPSLSKTRTILRAMFIEYGRAIRADKHHHDPGKYIYRAYGLANFAHDVIAQAKPALAERGCDVSPLL